MTGIALTLIVATLIGIELGYLFYVKREYQKTADLAALAGAQRLTSNNVDKCDIAIEAATANSLRNSYGTFISTPECGNWSISNSGAAAPQGCFGNISDHFDKNGSTKNAVRVRISNSAPRTPLSFLHEDRAVCVQAIAAIEDPRASFALGSGVVRLNEGLLNQLMGMLLGTNVGLSLADYTGLANSNVNLLGIANALELNTGTYNELLQAKVTLKSLLNATIQAATKTNDSNTVAAATSAINGLINLAGGIDLAGNSIYLIDTADRAGLLKINLDKGDPNTALNGNISALNLVTTALQIANNQSGIATQIGIPLSPLANVKVQAKVIEPPTIAVGPPGYYSDGSAKTQAHTGQIRAKIDAQVLTPASGNNNILDINVLIARVKIGMPSGQLISLPIYVETASADALLDEVRCDSPDGKYDVQIIAAPSLSHIYLGEMPLETFTNDNRPLSVLAHNRFNLVSLAAEIQALGVTILRVPIAVQAKLGISIPGNNTVTSENLDYRFDPKLPASQQTLIKTIGMEEKLGASIKSALTPTNPKLDVALDTSGIKLPPPLDYLIAPIVTGIVSNLSPILTGVLGLLNPLLAPVFAAMDVAISPLLKALGVQLGYTDVQLLSATCEGNASLVY